MRKQLTVIFIAVGLLAAIGVLYATPQPPSRPAPRNTHQDKNDRQDDSPFGSIEGYVYDTNGQPVAGATAHAERIDAIMTKTPSAETNEHGKFLIKGAYPGTYIIYGSKKKDGYPRTTSGFHYKDPIIHPQVNVHQQQVTSDVAVPLRQRVPKLILRILDMETNKPIGRAGITMRHADKPDYLYSMGVNQLVAGEIEILAPYVPFTIEVEAPGYENWRYERVVGNRQVDNLQLAPDGTEELTISLRPLK